MSSVPELDDMEFDRLREQGIALIPRYAPEWTDHNVHDPGITLIELIAYLADRQIYRIGFVGESLERAFTRLLGVTAEEPRPARMSVWPRGQGGGASVFAAGTPIETVDLDEANWTLDADIRTVLPRIAGLVAVSAGGGEKPLGTGLAEGRDPLPLLPFAGGGPHSLEIRLSDHIAAAHSEGYVSLGVLLENPAAKAAGWEPIGVEQWHEGGYWRPLETLDCTLGLARDGVILFRPRDSGAAGRFRLRLDAGFRPAAVTLVRLGLNVLPATEGTDHAGLEAIGESNGLPDQFVPLRTDDLVEDGHVAAPLGGARRPLRIFSGDAPEHAWEAVDSFDKSGPDERHVRVTTDGLHFGNGLNGFVPPKGAQIRHDPLRRTAGVAGAVAAGLDWRIAGVDYGRNLTPSTEGRDAEALSDLIDRARSVARDRDGYLRSEALEDDLREAALGLLRVGVAPGRRPGRQDAATPGSRTVLVLPSRDPALPPRAADPALLLRIGEAIAPGRLLGERFHVSPPLYRDVDVAADLIVEADAEPDAVRAEAERRLRRRLWDLPRTADQTLAPWPAGRTVTVGEIETLMAGLEAVIRVTDCRIAEAGASLSRNPIPLADREIALAREIRIDITRHEEGRP